MNGLFGDTRATAVPLGPVFDDPTKHSRTTIVPQCVVTIKLTYEIQPVVAAYILFNGEQSHYSRAETTPVHHTRDGIEYLTSWIRYGDGNNFQNIMSQSCEAERASPFVSIQMRLM